MVGPPIVPVTRGQWRVDRRRAAGKGNPAKGSSHRSNAGPAAGRRNRRARSVQLRYSVFNFVLDGRCRSAPRSMRPSDPDPSHQRPDRAPQRAGWAPSGAYFLHVLRCPRAVARAAPRRRRPGLHRAHPGPARGHPASSSRAATCSPAPRPAPARPRPSSCPSSSSSTPRRPARAQPPVAAGPPVDAGHRPPARPRPRRRPHARARHPGRGERPDLRQAPPVRSTTDLRRRRLRAPGLQAPRRPRDRRRDARPAARPRRPADHRPVAGRDPRPRRGRPDARHGLHPRHPQDPRPAPAAAARTCCSRRRSPTTIRGLADGLLHEPAHVQVTPAQHDHRAHRPGRDPGRPRAQARPAARSSSRSGRIDQALVFTRTKHGANRLAEQLGKDGISAAAIHGNKSQAQRVRALDDFKAGRVGDPRRDRHRRPRHRHRAAAARRQLRAADGARGLRPPHRPHRPRRHRRRRDLAGLRRRAAAPPGHPGAAPAPDPDRDDRRASSPNRNVRPEPIRLRSTPAERAERLAARGGQPSSGRGGHPSAGRGQSGAGRGPGRPANGRHGGRPSGDQPHGSPMTHGSPPRTARRPARTAAGATTASPRRSRRGPASATRRRATGGRCLGSASAAWSRADRDSRRPRAANGIPEGQARVESVVADAGRDLGDRAGASGLLRLRSDATGRFRARGRIVLPAHAAAWLDALHHDESLPASPGINSP